MRPSIFVNKEKGKKKRKKKGLVGREYRLIIETKKEKR